MAKIETQYVLVGRDQTQRAFRSLRGNVRRAERAIFSLQSAFLALGAGQALRGIARAGIQIQRIERGLETATGSAEAAARELGFVRDTANELGLDLETAAQSFTNLSAAAQGTAIQGRETREIFTAVSQASRALGISADQTQGAFRAIEQIISKGTVQAEELRGQLGERLPGAFQIAAKAMGVTTQELGKLLERGEVVADEFLPRFADELQNRFASAATSAANDAQAAFNRFSTAIFELQAAIAESGVLDALADLATGTANAVRGLSVLVSGASGFGEQSDKIRDKIRELVKERDQLRSGNPATGGLLGLTPSEAAARVDAINAELQRLRTEQLEVLTGGATGGVQETNAALAEQVEVVRGAALGWQEYQQVLDSAGGASDFGTGGITIDRSTRLGMEEYLDMLDRIDTEVQEVNRTAEELGFTFTSAFEDAIIEGEKFSVVLQGLLKDIARIFLRQAITNPIADFFGGIFPKKSAIGGPVGEGRPYIVGERGPELFVPRSSGSIVPNNKMGGGGDIYVTNNVDGSGLSPAQLLAVLESNNQRVIGEIAQRRREGRL